MLATQHVNDDPRPSLAAIRVVVLTPPGRGAVATLLVEGPGAAELVRGQLATKRGTPPAHLPDDRPTVAHFGTPAGEEVVVRRRSDESVELHCHGGDAAVTLIQETLVRSGCRSMTWREWVAGQESCPIAAAARIALADARTERTAAILLDQYRGALRRALDEIDAARANDDAAEVQRLTAILAARAALGRHLTQPWQVVFTGRANVGKSSLVNALVGYRRVIVHAEPGTTRDVVTVATAIDGWPVELSDTAGVHPAGDALAEAAAAAAEKKLAAADLVVVVFDAHEPWSAEDQRLSAAWPEALVVYNKSDLPPAGERRRPGLTVSALGGEGIEALLSVISARLVPDPPPPGAAVPL